MEIQVTATTTRSTVYVVEKGWQRATVVCEHAMGYRRIYWVVVGSLMCPGARPVILEPVSGQGVALGLANAAVGR